MRAAVDRRPTPLFVPIPAAWLEGFRALYPPLQLPAAPVTFATEDPGAVEEDRLRQPHRYSPERAAFTDWRHARPYVTGPHSIPPRRPR